MDDSADFRWQDEEQLHLTLRFVGEVERPLADDLALRWPRFSRPVRGSHRRRRPVRAAQLGRLMGRGRAAAPLAALAAKVERACLAAGLEPERRAFHPHITLARWKGRRTREVADFLERRRALASPPFPVEAFILFESRLSRHGARYEEAASFLLE